ncbi:MAG: NAD-dependent deacylase [Thermodesulfobacteriota bacterium]
MHESWQSGCVEAARLLAGARKAVALTGAGVSVPSGIPDFRSPGGLWTRFDPMRVATAAALRNDPAAVWEFMTAALDLFGQARPNPAHAALAELERRGRLAGIVTQNIDGLHQAAGSRAVVEFHGSADRFSCMDCGQPQARTALPGLLARSVPPRCPDCGGAVRPDVVFFGEGIPREALAGSEELLAGADLALIVGTSGEVAPANYIPFRVARAGGAVVEVNLGPTAYGSLADVRLDAPAEVVLPRILELLPA